MRRSMLVVCASIAAFALAACTGAPAGEGQPTDVSAEAEPATSEKTRIARAQRVGRSGDFGPAPEAPQGAYPPELAAAVDALFGEGLAEGVFGEADYAALQTVALSKDVRVAWLLTDLLRIADDRGLRDLLGLALSELMGVRLPRGDTWRTAVDHLIAWDTPAPPDYLAYKRRVYLLIEPAWDRIFQPGDIDWRHVSWGGVRIDDRPFGETDAPCNCIPAADDPPVLAAGEATWLRDGDVVFGIVVNGEARAYPRRIMEVREMVNDTLGGRQLGIPYCTLCGSAQAWFTDSVPEGATRPVLRTSGLLIRSNKVMYDRETFSVFDTFRGNAVTGPLARRGVQLEQAGVVTARWGEWKAAHPETTVLVERLALGRDFDFRNGRDANGPIFPVGDVDPRLGVQADVLGVIAPDGRPVAFPVDAARAALERGEPVVHDTIRLELDGGGVRAVGPSGEDVGGHQAFWFAWSQFYPLTVLWAPPAR